MRQRMEDPKQTKLEDYAKDQEVEVEHWLQPKVAELQRLYGLSRRDALYKAREEERNEETVRTNRSW